MKGLPVMVRAAALMLALPVCAAVARADVKIKVKQTMAGHATEQTTYIKGKRRRTEMMGGAMTTIQQCDLRRDIQLSDATKTYAVTYYAQDDAPAAARTPAAGRPASQAATRGGVITTTMTSKDTGERKQMFGHTARRVITTMVTESSPDACSVTKTRMEVDGWYIDAAFAPDCDAGRTYHSYMPQQNAGCQDRYVTKMVGTAKTGYPLSTKTTIYGENGEAAYTMLMETVEISQQATLDAALFEVPAGYREVKDASELYTGAAVSRGASGNGETNEGDEGDSDSEEPSNSGASASASAGSANRQSSEAPPAAKTSVRRSLNKVRRLF